MARSAALDRTLAIVGAVLAALPLVAMVGLSFAFLVSERVLLVDWFLPAELLPVHLAGVAGLAFVAFRTRRRRAPLVAGALTQLGALVLTQVVATATGLASGERVAEGWPFALVVGIFVVFFVAHAATAVVGILLARDLRRSADAEPSGV